MSKKKMMPSIVVYSFNERQEDVSQSDNILVNFISPLRSLLFAFGVGHLLFVCFLFNLTPMIAFLTWITQQIIILIVYASFHTIVLSSQLY